MRVAYDEQIFCRQSYGGISRYFVQLSLYINYISGFDSRIFAPLHKNRYLRDHNQDFVEGRYLDSYPPKTTLLIQQLNSMLSGREIAKWKPDIVHETFYKKGGVSSRKSKTVLTVYDMIHELFPQSFSSADTTSELKRKAVERADHVICISEHTKNDLIRLFGIKKQNVTVVHLGFGGNSLSVKDNIPKAQMHERPYVLYVGNRGGYKNFDLFLKAFASSSPMKADYKIKCFGGGDFNRSELQLASDLGLTENQFQYVNGDDSLLREVYSSARLLVYPSLYEGFGIPPLEAMSSGCPVACSNASSLPEVVGDSAILFDPNCIDDIRHSMEVVAYSDDVYSRLVELGKLQIRKFSWEKCANNTANIYKSLL